MPIMTIADIMAENEAMNNFHAELDEMLRDMGYDPDVEFRENADFEILLSQPIGNNEEIVFGRRPSDGSYVTWMCSGGNNYYWGHYFGGGQLLDAMRDFVERSEANVQTISA